MITLATSSDDTRWDAFVRASAEGHLYHLSAWRRMVEALGHPTYYLMSEDTSGAIDGLLPIARLKSRLFGDFMVSMPYVNYGGPCAASDMIKRTLVNEAVQLAARNRVQHLELRLSDTTDFGLRVRSAKASMRLRLPASTETLWSGFPSKLRSQVKRAQQEDMTVRIGQQEELDGFYEVFAENMRDLGTPAYGKAFFAAILREFPHSATICSVCLRGEPVASGILLGFRDTIEIPWASSLKRHNRLSPNMLLYWSALEFAVRSGYRVFDFGRSSPDSGPFRFKAQWGAAPQSLHWHYWVPDGAGLPDLSPRNPRYQTAIRVWQHLPISVTKLVGPLIVKNLP